MTNRENNNQHQSALIVTLQLIKGYIYIIFYLLPFMLTTSPVFIDYSTAWLSIPISISGFILLVISHLFVKAITDVIQSNIKRIKDQLISS